MSQNLKPTPWVHRYSALSKYLLTFTCSFSSGRLCGVQTNNANVRRTRPTLNPMNQQVFTWDGGRVSVGSCRPRRVLIDRRVSRARCLTNWKRDLGCCVMNSVCVFNACGTLCPDTVFKTGDLPNHSDACSFPLDGKQNMELRFENGVEQTLAPFKTHSPLM